MSEQQLTIIQSKAPWDNKFDLPGRRHFLLLTEGRGRDLGIMENYQKAKQKKQVTPAGIYKGTLRSELEASAVLHQNQVRGAAAGAGVKGAMR